MKDIKRSSCSSMRPLLNSLLISITNSYVKCNYSSRRKKKEERNLKIFSLSLFLLIKLQ